jgi:hypothetical protein
MVTERWDSQWLRISVTVTVVPIKLIKIVTYRIQDHAPIAACSQCRGNVFTPLMPCNERRARHTLRGFMNEAWRSDGLRCHNTLTKWHKDWFTNSNVTVGNAQRPEFSKLNKK